MRILIGNSILITMTAIAAMTDIKYRKVYNKQLLLFILAELGVSLMFGGMDDLSLGGFILPALVHYIPFRMRLVSAGDVKLFMVIGFFVGYEFIITCMMYSYLIGGIVAFVVMVVSGEFLSRMRKLKTYFFNCLLSRTLLPYEKCFQPVNECASINFTTIPFAFMIHLAVLGQIILTIHTTY